MKGGQAADSTLAQQSVGAVGRSHSARPPGSCRGPGGRRWGSVGGRFRRGPVADAVIAGLGFDQQAQIARSVHNAEEGAHPREETSVP